MHKIIILNQSYPNPKSGDVGSAFVHVRAKFYSKYFNVEVVKVSSTEDSYMNENIIVTCCKTYSEFLNYIKVNRPHALLAHFCEPWMNAAASINNIPLIVWVHGSEAHSWHRILFNVYWGNIKDFIKFIYVNIFSLRNFHRMIKHSRTSKLFHFVFVSDWMKRITFTDTFSKTDKYSIVPNPIDLELFKYNEKQSDNRKKILILRSFNSSKYANDISVDAILKLSKKSFFNELQFTIYGKGVHWEKLTSKISHFKNVQLINKLVPQSEIPALHKQNGIFLCPTRMDAQGVSMCEAMASGLVPVTSNNTAIPEFVKHNESGFLTNSASEIADAIERLYQQPELFLKISNNASKSISSSCGMDVIINKEKQIINEIISINTV